MDQIKAEREASVRSIEVEPEYEEQVIEKWFHMNEMPDDLHSACLAMIPIET